MFKYPPQAFYFNTMVQNISSEVDIAQLIKKILHLQHSLPCSEKSVTGPYPGPSEYRTLFLKINFNTILPSRPLLMLLTYIPADLMTEKERYFLQRPTHFWEHDGLGCFCWLLK
jgi:hypothetical protein